MGDRKLRDSTICTRRVPGLATLSFSTILGRLTRFFACTTCQQLATSLTSYDSHTLTELLIVLPVVRGVLLVQDVRLLKSQCRNALQARCVRLTSALGDAINLCRLT